MGEMLGIRSVLFLLLSGIVGPMAGCMLVQSVPRSPPYASGEIDRTGEFVKLDFQIRINGQELLPRVEIESIDKPDLGGTSNAGIDKRIQRTTSPADCIFAAGDLSAALELALFHLTVKVRDPEGKPVSLARVEKTFDDCLRSQWADCLVGTAVIEAHSLSASVAQTQDPGFLVLFAACGRPDPTDACRYRGALCESLHNSIPRQRAMAASGLGHLGVVMAETVPDLMTMLRQDPNPIVRLYAAQSIWQICGEAELVLPTLQQALQSNVPDVPGLAALFLGRMGPAASPAVPALCAALGSPDEETRAQAMYALGMIGPPASAAVPALQAAARDSANDAKVNSSGDEKQHSVKSFALFALKKITRNSKTP